MVIGEWADGGGLEVWRRQENVENWGRGVRKKVRVEVRGKKMGRIDHANHGIELVPEVSFRRTI